MVIIEFLLFHFLVIACHLFEGLQQGLSFYLSQTAKKQRLASLEERGQCTCGKIRVSQLWRDADISAPSHLLIQMQLSVYLLVFHLSI